MRAPEKFKSEAALCAAFIEAAIAGQEWLAYPESAGFDILLVRKADGAQIGVEAKLRLNGKVIAQALPQYVAYNAAMVGPDFRAVLIPQGCASDLGPVCAALGITAIRFDRDQRNQIWPRLPTPRLTGGYFDETDWFDWAPMERCAVPEYVPDVSAGASAPLKLTTWKIKAIKLAIILESRVVTRADFKALQLDPSRWTDPYSGWLAKADGGYVKGAHMPNFKAQHPRNWVEIEADSAKWMPAPVARQEALL